MRFICCARHKGEQNLFAFQYNKEIYYRAFYDIPAKTELLVWYEDTYPQYMGIPLKITDIGLQAQSTSMCFLKEKNTVLYRTTSTSGSLFFASDPLSLCKHQNRQRRKSLGPRLSNLIRVGRDSFPLGRAVLNELIVS